MSERTRPHAGAQHAHDSRDQQTADRIGEALRFPIDVARRVLPERELPIYLTVGALAVAGVVDWPVAAAAGLGYAALRRWGGGRQQEREDQPEGIEDRAHRAARVRADGAVTASRRTMTRH